MRDDDGRRNGDSSRDVNECSSGDKGGMESRQLFGAELLRLGHEVRLEQLDVFDGRFQQGRDNHSRGQRRRSLRPGCDERVVQETERGWAEGGIGRR